MALNVCSMALAGDGSSDNISLEKVGGLSTNFLFVAKKDAPVLKVDFEEIIVTNGIVTFSGIFTRIPGRSLIIDPMMLQSALACTLLSPEGGAPRFRLVADDEFSVVELMPWEERFKRSNLAVWRNANASFRYSYAGFASKAKFYGNKPEMDDTVKFRDVKRVKYQVNRFLCVRFMDQDYYPQGTNDFSYVNMEGEGSCKIRIE